ncbi:nitroreductase family deazaflavin-dependent oxidoreductase [Kribbella sancticallisti]|uniref:Nitroreductase family deazaflavin-dependent oxidoreductase n=1 Tax=Kribbella sancticallisti TaxID=460087 RepID=A0ABP4QC88_9ACTN
MGWYTNVIRSLGHRPWFAAVGRAVVPLDRWLQRTTGGRVTILGRSALPTLLLTTKGRKSGLPRTVPLLYAPDGDAFVVTASNWGQKEHPAWSANLLACCEATVLLSGGREVPVRSALAEGPERDRVWPLVTRVWPAYDTYVERSGRAIRVFVLTPS